jgi:hypothetical protein
MRELCQPLGQELLWGMLTLPSVLARSRVLAV